jgi:hypothetical protein
MFAPGPGGYRWKRRVQYVGERSIVNVREKGSVLSAKKRVRAPLTTPKGLVVQTRRHELVRLAGKRTGLPAEQIPGYYLG